MAEDGDYRTDNLALATLLAMRGYEYELAKLTQRKAIWIFTPTPETEEEFDDLVADWDEFACKVEPRQFILRFTEMRSELFAKVGRPVAPASAGA